MALTLPEANRIVRAAVAKAEEMNVKLSVAVCDETGRLLAFNRMDGAIWLGAYAAEGKAVASAGLGRASSELAGLAESPVFAALQAMEGGHLVPAQGALPIRKGGELVGAVGASGGTGQEDEDCARAGLESL